MRPLLRVEFQRLLSALELLGVEHVRADDDAGAALAGLAVHHGHVPGA